MTALLIPLGILGVIQAFTCLSVSELCKDNGNGAGRLGGIVLGFIGLYSAICAIVGLFMT